VTTEDDLLTVAQRELGPSSRWMLTLQRDDRGFVLVADHPASAGLMIETGTLDYDLAARRISSWMGQREVAVAERPLDSSMTVPRGWLAQEPDQ
jgi:hypothetical protein